MEKGFNKKEKFVCELLWGGVPVDIGWVRESKMFIEGMKRFENDGDWKSLYARCNVSDSDFNKK